MVQKNFVCKGDICYSKDMKTLETCKDGYLVCENGVSAGVFAELPEKYQDFPLLDYTGKLILPGFTDLHVHAPSIVSAPWVWIWNCWNGWTLIHSLRKQNMWTRILPERITLVLWKK